MSVTNSAGSTATASSVAAATTAEGQSLRLSISSAESLMPDELVHYSLDVPV
ncbi:MAG: hypothetical protein K0R55_3059 [Sporomusa sp.]|jgi:hypothetical protein|nr:hypothetical protein [Sporomusa sp.]